MRRGMGADHGRQGPGLRIQHVRKGGRIIGVMTDLEMKALEQRTRELFTECLVSLRAVTKDMDVFTVSREDIERLVGE